MSNMITIKMLKAAAKDNNIKKLYTVGSKGSWTLMAVVEGRHLAVATQRNPYVAKEYKSLQAIASLLTKLGHNSLSIEVDK